MTMNRFVCLFFATALALAVTGCGDDGDPKTTGGDTTGTGAEDATTAGGDEAGGTGGSGDATTTTTTTGDEDATSTTSDEDATTTTGDEDATTTTGDEDGGTTGDGMSTGVDVQPPPTVCESYCALAVDAGCDSPNSVEQCASGCESLSAACPAQFAAAAACAGANAAFTCIEGEAIPTGCETEVAALLGCTQGPCQQTCEAISKAGCAGNAPTVEECIKGCETSAGSCPEEYAATQVCIADEGLEVVCDGGFAAFKGCEEEQNAILACVDPCSLYCQGIALADCENGPDSFKDCLSGCNKAKVACGAQFTAAAECVGTDLDFNCVDGAAVAKGCETEQAALLECSSGSEPETYCDAACVAVVAASCANGPKDVAECVVGCKGAAEGPCAAEQEAVVSCAGNDVQTYVCLDPSGFPVPEGCEDVGTALQSCLFKD